MVVRRRSEWGIYHQQRPLGRRKCQAACGALHSVLRKIASVYQEPPRRGPRCCGINPSIAEWTDFLASYCAPTSDVALQLSSRSSSADWNSRRIRRHILLAIVGTETVITGETQAQDPRCRAHVHPTGGFAALDDRDWHRALDLSLLPRFTVDLRGLPRIFQGSVAPRLLRAVAGAVCEPAVDRSPWPVGRLGIKGQFVSPATMFAGRS